MAGITIIAPRGERPRLDAQLLDPNLASAAVNCKLVAGRLDPLRAPVLAYQSQLQGRIARLFHYQHNEARYWLTWATPVDVVRSPVAGDTLGRLYWTGEGEPRYTTFSAGIQGSGGPWPAASFALGVPAPAAAPAVAVSGGSLAAVNRSWVYTYRTALGEESGPSLPVLASGAPDGTWTISNLETGPAQSGAIVSIAVSAGVALAELASTRHLERGTRITVAGTSGLASIDATHTITRVVDGTRVEFAFPTAGNATGGAWSRAAPWNTAGMTKRIYRTEGAATTDYYLAAEIPVAQTSVALTNPSVGIALPTLENDPPPPNLHSLIALPNGALAALSGNLLCFSEIGQPHNWPNAYRYGFPATGIALGAVGNNVVILTDGTPFLATATVPAAVSLAPIETFAPCVSKASVVDIGSGILYASHDGLYLAQAGPVALITQQLYSKTTWERLRPTTFAACHHQGTYFARHQRLDGADQIFSLDTREPDSTVQIDDQPDAWCSSPWDGHLYFAKGSAIYQWDANTLQAKTLFWQSKEFVLPNAQNMGAAQVYAEFAQLAPPNEAALLSNQAALLAPLLIEGAIGSGPINSLAIATSALVDTSPPVTNTAEFTLCDDQGIVFTKVLRDNKPFKLRSGFKSDRYCVRINSTVPIRRIAFGNTMRDLKSQ
jgi:hypothetical protein